MENELMEKENNTVSKWDEVEDTLPQRSLRKFIEDLFEEKSVYYDMCYNNKKYTLDESDRIERNFTRDVRILEKADEALDFVKSSTDAVMKSLGKDKMMSETATLFKNPKDYAKAVVTLTCGFNERFADAVRATIPSLKTKMGDSYTEIFEEIFNENYKYMLNFPPIKAEIDKLLPYEADLTVKDLENTIDDISAMREELGMSPKYNVILEANYKLKEQEKNGTENFFERSYQTWNGDEVTITKVKPPYEDVEIVESNDGEVMNISANARAQENTHVYDAKVEQGNKVIHNEPPRETTNSMADVKGNVKFEQAKDVGSKEMAEINSGNGTDQDIETAIKSGHSELRSQSDRNSDNYER